MAHLSPRATASRSSRHLKLKGSSTVLKRGTMIRNIHLTDNEDEVEGRTDKV